MVEQTRISLSSTAFFTRLDPRSGVVLELTRKRYYRLSETATEMLELLLRHKSLPFGELTDALHQRYDVERSRLSEDLAECIAGLRERHVVLLDGSEETVA